MRRTFIVVFAVMVLLAGSPLWATAPDMVLAPGATLYRLAPVDDQLAVVVSSPAEESLVIPVPQTTGVQATAPRIDYDRATTTIVAVWQENTDPDTSRIMLATYHEGTWFGPVQVSDDAAPAINPSLLVHDARILVPAEDDESEDTFVLEPWIHLAWWADPGAEDGGHAMYLALPLDGKGVPALEEAAPVELRSLLPFGLSCGYEEDMSSLAAPRLFVDAQTGEPHLIFADLSQCLFEIVRLHPEPEGSDDDGVLTEQRRRNVIVFGVRKHIAIRPGLRLTEAQFEVGHDLSVVLSWDETDEEGATTGISYITLRDEGWSELNTLRLGEDLDHERAMALIRRLAR